MPPETGKTGLLRTTQVLRASMRGDTLTVTSARGQTATARLTRISSGGYNTVYAARGTGLVVRVSNGALTPEELAAVPLAVAFNFKVGLQIEVTYRSRLELYIPTSS